AGRRASHGPRRTLPRPNIEKTTPTSTFDQPSCVVTSGAYVVMNAPKPAMRAKFETSRTTSGRRASGADAEAWASSAVAPVASAGEAWARSSRTAGRGRKSAAPVARALVTPTRMNGTRRAETAARSPPIAGPRTEPAAPEADRTPFANARLALAVTWVTYRRSATWLTPEPRPANAR